MSSSWFSHSLRDPYDSDDEISPPQSPTATATATDKPGFSIITQTIGRQLQNVASFLAPPPHQQPSSSTPPLLLDDSGDVSPSSTSSYKGIKNDLAEISGSFKTGLSLLSSKKAVSEISKFASNLLQFDQEKIKPAGITDDVIKFVQEISLRAECWTDFPLSLQHQNFNISDVQKEHTSAIQQLVPNLSNVKHKIHNHVSEEQFWMIYFILLLPRLNEDDYKVLSTPQIVQIREVLLQKLRDKNNAPMVVSEDTNRREAGSTSLSEKGSLVKSTEQDKATKSEKHEDGVSFSDLEDEDNDLFRRLRQKESSASRHSSGSDASDWVRLNELRTSRSRHSESEESDWVGVGDDL